MISVILINYRQKDFTAECVKSIYSNFKSYPFEVIVINNSQEENLFYLEKEFVNLKVILNENRGFSHASNKGAAIATGEYLFFLNADTVIRSDFLKQFTNVFGEKSFGAAGLRLKNTDETFQLSFWKENNFFNEIRNKSDENKFRKRDNEFILGVEKNYNKVSQVDWVSGAAMIIKNDIFKSINGFDENYFLFYEDADICRRLSEAGFNNYFYPFTEIIHYKGENVNNRFQSDSYYYSKESQLLYYKKHNNLFNSILLRIYLFVKFFIKYIFTLKKINLRIVLLTIGIKQR